MNLTNDFIKVCTVRTDDGLTGLWRKEGHLHYFVGNNPEALKRVSERRAENLVAKLFMFRRWYPDRKNILKFMSQNAQFISLN